jgi:hypothetical protein
LSADHSKEPACEHDGPTIDEAPTTQAFLVLRKGFLVDAAPRQRGVGAVTARRRGSVRARRRGVGTSRGSSRAGTVQPCRADPGVEVGGSFAAMAHGALGASQGDVVKGYNAAILIDCEPDASLKAIYGRRAAMAPRQGAAHAIACDAASGSVPLRVEPRSGVLARGHSSVANDGQGEIRFVAAAAPGGMPVAALSGRFGDEAGWCNAAMTSHLTAARP